MASCPASAARESGGRLGGGIPWVSRRPMTAAIVTGSDSGIGRAAAVALAEDGFDVGVTWHSDEEGARGTAREITDLGRRAEVRRLDLTSLPGAAGDFDELCEALGGIDVLVNCAGAGASSPF